MAEQLPRPYILFAPTAPLIKVMKYKSSETCYVVCVPSDLWRGKTLTLTSLKWTGLGNKLEDLGPILAVMLVII